MLFNFTAQTAVRPFSKEINKNSGMIMWCIHKSTFIQCYFRNEYEDENNLASFNENGNENNII